MESVLQGIPGVCVYINDILVTGRDDQDHLEHLEEVLRRLKEAGMRLKSEKCEYLRESVEYLGHTIDREGLRTSDAKVQAIYRLPHQRMWQNSDRFLGYLITMGSFCPT
jgi:beta-lactamase superfamily II metal-dependent hydrolase